MVAAIGGGDGGGGGGGGGGPAVIASYLSIRLRTVSRFKGVDF